MNHLILEKMFRYKIQPERSGYLSNYSYDRIKGYWVNRTTGEALIKEALPNPPRTKKEDIETGEDRKGE